MTQHGFCMVTTAARCTLIMPITDIKMGIIIKVMPVGYANSEPHTNPLHIARTKSTNA